MEMNRCHQTCVIGYEFCEPQKMICRQCSEFDEYCFKDIIHIANCSTYCKERFPAQDTCTNNNNLWLYIPTAVSIVVIMLVSGYSIYIKCRRYRKVRRNLPPADTTSTVDEKEHETCLMIVDTQPKDTCVHLRELEEESNGNNTTPLLNGLKRLNQVPTTNEHTCTKISVSGKQLNPRDN